MKRFLSVWLPRWSIERRFRQIGVLGKNGLQPLNSVPFVLSAPSQNGQHITATNPAADELGLHKELPLADARAIYPSLIVEPADPEGDSAALTQLALRCQCYSPFTRVDAPDGFSIDITGCAHLFGGEAALLATLERRLENFRLTARLVTAPTIGAAWAAARYGGDKRIIITTDTLHEHLTPLPTTALRLEAPTIIALVKVGLKQIGDLLKKPRAPIVARFGSQVIERLDQAFGKQDENFCALTPPPSYYASCRFAEPIVTLQAIESAVYHLARDLSQKLHKAGKGARKVTLTLFRVDGWSQSLDVRITSFSLSRDANHLTRLLCERLDNIKDHTGFGFEAASLNALDVENVVSRQNRLQMSDEQNEKTDDLARLIDRLINRFGAHNVTRFTPCTSYIPERTVRSVSVVSTRKRYNWMAHANTLQGSARLGRPVFLFTSPEPVTTLAEAPDGVPVRFEWRRRCHRITRADGPERIAPEWWRLNNGESRQTRDYYRVEDDAGRRFWLYRDGLHERENDTPRWFIHGVFS